MIYFKALSHLRGLREKYILFNFYNLSEKINFFSLKQLEKIILHEKASKKFKNTNFEIYRWKTSFWHMFIYWQVRCVCTLSAYTCRERKKHSSSYEKFQIRYFHISIHFLKKNYSRQIFRSWSSDLLVKWSNQDPQY